MTKKRSTKPPLVGFGERLEDLRNGVSREIISRKLEKLGAPIGGSTLAQYEKGAVWAPDAAVLWGLAYIYGVNFLDLVALLRENRRSPSSTYKELRDLVRQTGDQASGPQGRSDAAAQTRIQQLERELEAKDRFIAQTQEAALRLFSLYAAAAKGGGAGKAESGRGGPRRKTS